ncbi:MAG: M28 family peptidase [Deltaproteobacteria bacterium]|nr:M28 family peptidase [Deltaproteobacteria bacterium]
MTTTLVTGLPGDLPARLEADVRHLVTAFAPRDHAHPENLDRAARWIEERFAAAGARQIVTQIFEVDGRAYRNVVASFGPGSESGERAFVRVVVGAHYDTAGPLPGANDNGSGVAALLELARRLGASPPAARVELVAWTLEEPPYFATRDMGSAVHARSLVAQRKHVRAVISLETIGVYHDAPGTQTYPDPAMAARYGDRGDFLALVGRLEEAPLLARVAPAFAGLVRAEVLAAPESVTGVGFSDHRSYWPYGFPAIMLTDTAFFRSDTYHTAADTPDKLDYARLARVADGVERAVRLLADEEAP